jgi:B12-binding domain/radical SAM domain protein
MNKVDLVLLHPPSVYDFRKRTAMYGPISDVVPSTPIFEMYPIGFITIAEYLKRHGYSVRILNVALKMLRNRCFCVEKLIKSLNPLAFGIDLHWLVHAQGGLELAKLIKKYHPRTPTIFGGLSASYYHKELIQYPQVDYVIRGDSAEEPLRQLLETIKQKSQPEDVSGLTWRDSSNEVRINEFSYAMSDLDDISFDYRSIIRSSVRYTDFVGHLPFQGWFNYPIAAVLPWRGCVHNCITCGGSARAYNRICGRRTPAYRSPELVVEDIDIISQHLKGPIIIPEDIRQGGAEYSRELLGRIKDKKISNHIAIELFSPASRQFMEMLAGAVPNFSVLISPESHDEEIRKTFGRNYDNISLEKTIEYALEAGCKRIDIFFMIGLPLQTSQSVKETIKYCDESLLGKFNKSSNGRIHPYISPLAPFLDPGSAVFENPQKFGYRLFYRTLEEHRQALLAPSWKYMLNYETEWMNRHEIVDCTYESAVKLNQIKVKYGLIKQKESEKIEAQMKKDREFMARIDNIVLIEDEKLREEKMNKLSIQLGQLGGSVICRKEELRWPVKSIRFNMFKVMQSALTGFK